MPSIMHKNHGQSTAEICTWFGALNVLIQGQRQAYSTEEWTCFSCFKGLASAVQIIQFNFKTLWRESWVRETEEERWSFLYYIWPICCCSVCKLSSRAGCSWRKEWQLTFHLYSHQGELLMQIFSTCNSCVLYACVSCWK